MVRFLLGVVVGVALVINFPEILIWFVDSGLRDEIVQKLQGVG